MKENPAERIFTDGMKSEGERLLRIDYVDVDEIFPNDYNPNTHDTESFDLLLKSLNYFGFTQPIVVHRPTMKIVDGEHRYRAACVLGYTKVPVCFVYFDELRLEYATIIHNRARGKNNEEMMARLLSDIESKGSDPRKVLLENRRRNEK